ncbi:MAG TPA: hypothetical protein VGM86_21140 [Thermoanaerobaculia bacterium]|jgi:hypothetical protein
MDDVLSFLKSYWKVLAGIVATIALVFKLDNLVEALRRWVALGAVQPKGSSGLLLSEAWGWGLAFGVVALLASLGLCVKLFLESRALKREQEARGEIMGKTLRGMMWAANRIANQLYPLAERPPFAFEKVSWSFHVESDGETRVTAQYLIRAYERPLHFWRMMVGAEPDAPGVDFLDSLGFKVQDAGGDRVAYLLRRNDSHRKEVSIFFLPQISPQEPARSIAISYTWPGMIKRLLTRGDEEFSFTLESRTQVSEVEYSFLFHPKLHSAYALDCRRESAEIQGERLDVKTGESGWKGWSYGVKNAPAEGFTYQLRLTAKRN